MKTHQRGKKKRQKRKAWLAEMKRNRQWIKHHGTRLDDLVMPRTYTGYEQEVWHETITTLRAQGIERTRLDQLKEYVHARRHKKMLEVFAEFEAADREMQTSLERLKWAIRADEDQAASLDRLNSKLNLQVVRQTPPKGGF